MFNLILVLTFVTLVKSHDIIVGTDNDGVKIFDEDRHANPAIWKQIENVTINAKENEVISKIIITDLRPEKDGDVKIVEGGEGQNNVTLELKSPTALRGFAFHIQVYSAPKDKVKSNTAGSTSTTEKVGVPHPSQTRQRREPEVNPAFNVPVATFTGIGDSNETRTNNNKKNIEKSAVNTKDSLSTVTPKIETDIEGLRTTRDTVKENEKNPDEAKNIHRGLTNPIITSKVESTGQLDRVSPTKTNTDLLGNDNKRGVRDTQNKDSNDHSKHTTNDENRSTQDSIIPAQSTENPTHPRDLKRQVSQPDVHNNNTTNTPNGRAFTPPSEFAITETPNVKERIVRDTDDENRNLQNKAALLPTLNDQIPNSYTSSQGETNQFGRPSSDLSQAKERKVRDTQEKKPVSPHTHITNDETKTLLPTSLNTEKQNPEGKVQPPIIVQKRNAQGETEQTRKPDTDVRRNQSPLPYAALSTTTTEKSQIKRQTEPKSTENEEKNKSGLKNIPQTVLSTSNDKKINSQGDTRRIVRDTEGKNPSSLHTDITKDDTKFPLQPRSNTEKPNPEDKAGILPPITVHKRNSQGGTEQTGKPITGVPKNQSPLPSSTLSTSTTEKSQIKTRRDTQPKSTEKEEKNKGIPKNIPRTVGQQKQNPVAPTSNDQKRNSEKNSQGGKSNVKERKVRNTEEKKPVSSHPDDIKLPLPYLNTEKPNTGDRAGILPPVTIHKRNSQDGIEQHGKPNTDVPKIPSPPSYATLSTTTTEKSQIKRDTDANSKENEEKNKGVLKNVPQTVGQQKPIHEQKPVVSIQ